MATATKKPEEARGIFDMDYWLGPLLHIARPDLRLRLAKRFQVSGGPDRGLSLGLGVDVNAATRKAFPYYTLERRLCDTRRLVVSNEVDLGKRPTPSSLTYFGQTWTVCDVKDKWHFQKLYVKTEIQAGVNMMALAPHLGIALDEWSVKPLWHPAALGVGALVYAGMFKYRVPLPLALTAAKVPIGDRKLSIGLQTETRRIESKPFNTIGIKSVLLTMNI